MGKTIKRKKRKKKEKEKCCYKNIKNIIGF